MIYTVADDAVTKAFQNLGNEWAVLAAGDENRSNAMTISWGSLGFIWQRPVITVLVRPQRHTHLFTEEFENLSVCFFDRSHRKALAVMGAESGRDKDKAALAGLTPTFHYGAPSFEEAYLTVAARKLYRGRFEPQGFLAPEIDEEFYPEKDYHTIYYAELLKAYGKR